MKSVTRISAYTLAALTAFSVAACSNVGKDPRFAMPAEVGQKVVVTPDQIAGHEFMVTDEDGPYWIRTAENGEVTAGMGSQTYVKNGTWRVVEGKLCLESQSWWKGGNCFSLYGGSTVKEATRLIPDFKKGPNSYFPFSFRR